MNTLDRKPALRICAAWRRVIPAALLAASLPGCLPGAPTDTPFGNIADLTSSVSRPAPPPIPPRKPQPPPQMLAQAAGTLTGAVTVSPGSLTEVVLSAPPGGARISVQALPSLPKSAAISTPEPVSVPAPAPPVGAVGAVTYRVQAGDTVFGVARRFAVPVRGVIDTNALRPPYGLQVGQVLRVPNPRHHRVEAGDTVYSVARRYGIDPSQIVSRNRIAAPYAITPGQSLVLPAAASPAAASPAIAQVSPALVTSPSATTNLAKIPAPPPRAGVKFLWPVQGHTIAGYGRKKNGLHNDGINIAAPRGASVRAADNGVVAYVGNELRGFGNLILVKHAGGWVTAYAHTQDFMVRRGQVVTRGQPIARIGSSGNVATPQLHFEIRKGTRSVNPTRYLGPQQAAG
jgi:murein DD-endopeptidase MepM/ murein hydrolase activator NlpD